MAEKLIYKQIERELLERIRSGRYLPGQLLPTEHELETEFSVSRMTVAKSMNALARAGYVERTRGRGTFVCDPLPEPAPTADDRLPGMLKYISPPSPQLNDGRFGGGTGMLEGLHEAARQTSYSVGIDFFASVEEQLEILQRYRRPLNDGYVVWPADDPRIVEMLGKLRADRFPFVLVDSFFPELVCDYVINDNADGARMMIRHLYETGHRRISYLTAPVDRVSQIGRAHV